MDNSTISYTMNTIPLSRAISPFQSSSLRSVNTIITARGALILAFIIALLLGPVANETDIVAAVISYSLLSFIILLTAITAVNGTIIRRDLKVRFSASEEKDQAVLVSGRETVFVLRTSRVWIPPLFVLQLQIEFGEEDLLTPSHQLTGRSRSDRIIAHSVTFPHRGIWRIKKLHVKFEDQLGFTQFRWTISSDELIANFKVTPPVHEDRSLPILSSCQRSGDMLTSTIERQGDPFDLKPYHPSDGMKKIIWKIYAKTGELISRHPEASMTPEGQVVVFCLATKFDDHVCGSAVGYLKYLEELDLDIFFACEGWKGDVIARTPAQAEDMLIDTVWVTENLSEALLKEQAHLTLSQCTKNILDSTIEKVLIFCSGERLSEPEQLARYIAVGDTLTAARVKPVYFVIWKNGQPLISSENATSSARRASKMTSLLSRFPHNWFIDNRYETKTSHPEHYSEFLNACAERKWDVVV